MLSEKLQLDDIDKKIITLVQEDPNLTHTEIASHINRSQPTVGMRIKKLESEGILQFQPGINFRKVDLYLAMVEMKTKNPEKIMEMAKYCPFMLNAFRISGDKNLCILLTSSQIIKLEKIVNYHFRNNPDIVTASMELITDIAKDFILPIDFNSDDHDPNELVGCGDKCKYRIAQNEEIEIH
jgi:DNA-binding Lrp family transcriptional regulator